MNSEKSIFDDMTMRDPERAFENAIRQGLKNPDDYMYMHSSRWKDYFKHCDTRCYRSFFNFSKLITVKEYKEKLKKEAQKRPL